MPSSTLKRSVATLGVVAGLLAATGPAGAGAHVGTATQPNDYGLATPQGFITKDGSVCDPIRHMGC
jgi:hypothetical protein